MSSKWNIARFVAALMMVVAPPSLAHAHGHDEDSAEIARQMAFFKSIVEFSETLRTTSAVTPTWKIAGQRVNAKGALADLITNKLRLWHTPLRDECGDCVPPDPAVWEAEARALVAKGFLEAKIGDNLLEAFEHIALGTADIGASLGIAPGVAKGVAEAAESVIALAKWGGAHVFCHLFDAIILFGTRPLQTATRAFTWAPSMDASRLATFARVGVMSSAIRRAERRVEFVKNGAAVLSPEDVAEMDAEGQNRWWGWFDQLGVRGKRGAWAEKLDRKGNLVVDGRVARGGRMKRYAYLLRRRRGHANFLKGDGVMDNALDHDVVWALSVQENVAQRAFKFEEQPPAQVLDSLADKYTPKTDDVRAGIAERFGKGNALRTELMSEILREVEVVFNPQVSRRIRYFQAKKIEGILSGFMRDNFLSTMHEAGELYSADAKNWLGRLGAVFKRVRMHVRAGRFTHYMLGVGDFMRIAASSQDASALVGKKYETMDAVRRIMETLQLSGQFADVENVEGLKQAEQDLAEAREELLAFRPWVEKKTAFSWIPFRKLRPRCEDMNRLATQ